MMKKICCFFFALSLCFLNISAANKTVIVCGDTVMINGQYNGVLISGQFDFEIDQQLIQTHPDDSVRIGDLIIEANQQPIVYTSDLNDVISSVPFDQNSIDVVVKRNNVQTSAKLYLYFDKTSSSFKTGLYIKDHITGTGTLTYYDPETHMYGALGHEIIEKSTQSIAELNQGQICTGKVTSIKQSLINQPGEKVSKNTGLVLGNILVHNQYGIFGKVIQPISGIEMEIASKHKIKLGSAKIMTVIHDNIVEEFDIMITSIYTSDERQIKNIELKITDPKLLETTGGIIQGMSGSPIIQDGKLVGAVTHVLVNDPTRGYGIFIENMLAAAE